MSDGITKLEDFFKIDLEIKKMLHNLVPPTDLNFDDKYIINYSDNLYKTLPLFQYYIIKIMNNFNFESSYIEQVNEIFKNYMEQLANCGMDFNKLKKFYNDNFSNMREQFINDVKSNIFGYGGDNVQVLIKDVKTINELLHLLHHSIVNNQYNYQNVPKVSEKTNSCGENIVLYGKDTELSKNIYDAFYPELDSGQVDILSLNNKILIMIRDVGHALSIEIEVMDNECNVRYFIPKICNRIMLNNLRGVKPVENSRFTVGEFRNSIDDIAKEIVDFIEKVPTDNDMYFEDELTETNLKK